MARKDLFQQYTDEYKTIVRQTWFQAGMPSAEKLYGLLPPDVNNNIPSVNTLASWRRDQLWDIWADELNSRAMTIVEDNLIMQKVEMLKRHAQDAAKLQEMGLTYLKEHKFDTSSAAVSAVIRGAELERTSRGVGELILKMAKMDDGALKNEIMALIARASENNQIVDVDLTEVAEETESSTVSNESDS
jgi:hypothetical protein